MALGAGEFAGFFKEMHGREPFPWQQALVEKVLAEGWPQVIDLPTASGKTACIDIAVFALAAAEEAPRRIFYVVDRRILVNDAFKRMRRIAQKLKGAASGTVGKAVAERLLELGAAPPVRSPGVPLDVRELRGGVYRDQSWVRSPLQPTVITSTVDQIGSRLLFRGYGVAPFSWPIHAALVAKDSLILLDEAHCSRAFAQTLDAVSTYNGPKWVAEAVHAPFAYVEMTATPARTGEKRIFRMGVEDRENVVLKKRLRSRKSVSLVLSKGKAGDAGAAAKALCDKAIEIALACGAKRVAVIVNRIATARLAAKLLEERFPEEPVELLIGRMRALDRDDLGPRLQPLYSDSPRTESEPRRWVVSTQCLEVGADLDFDVLVTECASIDALLQRFGRLDRTGHLQGKARGAIVVAASALSTKVPDPIYGEALGRTWNWLSSIADGGVVNFGIEAAEGEPATVSERLRQLPEAEAAGLRRLGSAAPRLFPSHLDALVQTCPRPQVEPEVALFLHGIEAGKPDVQVVWRADLPEGDPQEWAKVVALCPPVAAEAMPVRIWDLRRWMENSSEEIGADADLEGLPESPEGKTDKQAKLRSVLCWKGAESFVAADPGRIKPGDTVVVPASAEWEEFGHVPESGLTEEKSPRDWGDRGNWAIRRRATLRLHKSLIALWPEQESRKGVEAALGEEDPDLNSVMEALQIYREELRPSKDQLEQYSWLLDLLESLPKSAIRLQLLPYPGPEGKGVEGYLLRSKVRPTREAGRVLMEDAGQDEISMEGSTSLDQHTEQVVSAATALSEQLVPRFQSTYIAGARFHDAGKADLRFQALLRGGDRLAAQFAPKLLAKGEFPAAGDLRARRERSGLPEGFRHELLSALFLAMRSEEDLAERELALHLIASHHGRCRPFAPVIIDDDPDGFSWNGRGLSKEEILQSALHGLDAGVARRFWKLVRRFGWWGEAYLEAIFRLSDWIASEGQVEQEESRERVASHSN